MVILLDDDDDFRNALAANLRDDGYTVSHFSRPRDVPPLTSLESVSMLIVDYQMEGEDGLTFADRFHGTHPISPPKASFVSLSESSAAAIAMIASECIWSTCALGMNE